MRLLNRVILALLIASGGLAVLIGGLAWWMGLRPMPQTSGAIHVTGLRAECVVRRDSLGVPHVSAASLPDLYFAQGWVTAQERLWQMDMLRRMAGGTLAEVAGEAAARSDADKRMLGMMRIAEESARSLPPDQRAFLEAYAAGVNAFIEANRGRLPLEFRLMRYHPEPWKVRDSLLVGLQMFHLLTSTWRDELMKLMLISKLGEQRTAELLVTRSDHDHPPADEMRAQPVAAAASRSAGRDRRDSLVHLPLPSGQMLQSLLREGGGISLCSAPASEPGCESIPELAAPRPTPGSNNWVVSGTRSASGRAMLANDPHLNFSVPSIWFTVHLQAPGMNVAGVSLPGMPAVVLGHNERIAWGATNMGADVQDLYLEKFDPKNSGMYLVDGKWQRAEVRREKIAVKGGGDEEFSVVVTRHGPVVLNENHDNYALRWVAAEKGLWNVPFFRLNAARNWDEFRAALSDYPGPAQNFVYADADGNIGYQAAGKIPIRPRGDGSVPLPGESSANDWQGYIPFDQLPRVFNPPSGIIATANGRVVPDGYAYPVATKWESPDRTERIYELLRMDRRFRPEDFIKIQTDIYSSQYKMLAGALARALERRRPSDPRARRLAAQLGAWSGEVRADSSEASIVQFARHQMLKQLLASRVGPNYVWYRWSMSTIFLEALLRERPAQWLPAGTTDFDELLARSVEAAAANLAEHFHTPDSTRWPWGQLILTTFAHPLAQHLPGFLRTLFVVGPFPQSGNSYTVKQTTPLLGPSMRMVVDFGDLDKTLLTLTMGESGHVFSAHFKDQFRSWQRGEGLPLPFTSAAMERGARETLHLLP